MSSEQHTRRSPSVENIKLRKFPAEGGAATAAEKRAVYDNLLTSEVAGISVSEACTAADCRVCAHEVVGWKQGFCCDVRIWQMWCIGGEGGFGVERSVVDLHVSNHFH